MISSWSLSRQYASPNREVTVSSVSLTPSSINSPRYRISPGNLPNCDSAGWPKNVVSSATRLSSSGQITIPRLENSRSYDQRVAGPINDRRSMGSPMPNLQSVCESRSSTSCRVGSNCHDRVGLFQLRIKFHQDTLGSPVSPLRCSRVIFDIQPWADAHGYILSPLRG